MWGADPEAERDCWKNGGKHLFEMKVDFFNYFNDGQEFVFVYREGVVFAKGYSGGIPFFPQGDYSHSDGCEEAGHSGAGGRVELPGAPHSGAAKAVYSCGTAVSGALFIRMLRDAEGEQEKFSVDGMDVSWGCEEDLRVFPGVVAKDVEGCGVEGQTY